MNTIAIKLLLLQAVIFTLLASCKSPSLVTYKTVAEKNIYSSAKFNALLFSSGFAVDADGSPRAYHRDNTKALDYLANAGKPGNWWALVTDNNRKDGNPVIQVATDPAPGFYVSTTSLQDPSKKLEDPRRYVNSEAIPYLALPPGLSADFVLGDIALVINQQNRKKCYAIFADIGPSNKVGEGSIYLAQQLSINSNPKNGGTDSGIVYILIKKSGLQKVMTAGEIQVAGKAKLSDSDIRDLLKQLNP